MIRHLLLALLVSATPVHAVIEAYEFSDSTLEERYRDLTKELRCPKCQNQNIADSNAPISQDLRQLLYKQLEAGATDEEIVREMVARYGEFVTYRPRFDAKTAVLWLAPVAMLALAVVLVVAVVRRRGEPAPLDPLQAERLQALLAEEERRNS